MKRCLFVCFLLCATSTYAADFPPGTPAGAAPVVIDYLSKDKIPLTKKELKALQLSSAWSKTNIPPVMAGDGKIIYVHGAVLPTIIGSPTQVCDVELQAGEKIREVIVGDSARWLIDTGTSGAGGAEVSHLYIKPVDAGLESSAVVTTDLRVYHLRLISRRTGHTPYVGFSYAEQLQQHFKEKKEREDKEKLWASTSIDGNNVDLSNLNFDYRVKGNASWRPERVYDDGRQMFIRLPKASRQQEIPVLLVKKSTNDVLVNYRVKDSTMIVDGIFDRVALIVGVGKKQEKVEIQRRK